MFIVSEHRRDQPPVGRLFSKWFFRVGRENLHARASPEPASARAGIGNSHANHHGRPTVPCWGKFFEFLADPNL